MFIYFSSHGSSLIGLPFPPPFVVYCFCSCEVRGDLVCIDVCSDLVFGDVCSILLPTIRSDIFYLSATTSFIPGLRGGRT